MHNKGLLYVAMGDSITWMAHTFITQGSQFYATMVRNYIRQSSVGACRLINKGIGGSSASDLVQDLSWVSSLTPDLVTIGLGTNDCINSNETTTSFQTNLGTIIDRLRLQNPNVKIILCTAPQTADTNRQPVIQPFRDAMASVATSKNTGLVRWENAWSSSQNATYIGNDNVHPNPAGQLALYNMLLPVVQSQLGI